MPFDTIVQSVALIPRTFQACPQTLQSDFGQQRDPMQTALAAGSRCDLDSPNRFSRGGAICIDCRFNFQAEPELSSSKTKEADPATVEALELRA